MVQRQARHLHSDILQVNMAAEFTDLFGLWKMVFQEAYVPSISMMISGSILNTWHEGSAMDSVNLGLLLGCVDRRIDDPFYVIPTKQPFIHCCTYSRLWHYKTRSTMLEMLEQKAK